MHNYLLGLILIMISIAGFAADEETAIYKASTVKPMEETYTELYQALERSRFYVIFEANIGKNLARNKDKWGEDYNRNAFEAVKSMIICNPYFANQLLNLDPDLMALCPMSVTLLHKQGTTTILFEKLMQVSPASPAEDVLWEVETTVITAIESVL
jgi:uncharacterized protein (DUF302 family)